MLSQAMLSQERLGERMASMYRSLDRVAVHCGHDLYSAACDKFEKNNKKYPADKARGKRDKYTAYAESSDIADGSSALGVGVWGWSVRIASVAAGLYTASRLLGWVTSKRIGSNQITIK